MAPGMKAGDFEERGRYLGSRNKRKEGRMAGRRSWALSPRLEKLRMRRESDGGEGSLERAKYVYGMVKTPIILHSAWTAAFPTGTTTPKLAQKGWLRFTQRATFYL